MTRAQPAERVRGGGSAPSGAANVDDAPPRPPV